MRKELVFSSPHFFLDYKNIALFVLGAVLPCLTTCIPHKHPMLINPLFAYHFASHWIISVLRPKNMTFSKSWHHVSCFNEKTMCLSPLLSLVLWVQVPIWSMAGFKLHLRRTAVSLWSGIWIKFLILRELNLPIGHTDSLGSFTKELTGI